MTKTLQPVAKSTFRGLLRSVKAADTNGAAVAPTKIELLQTGEWDTPWHGKFVIDHSSLLEYVAHFNDGVRAGVPIDYEHNSYSDDGAAGWVESLEIAPTEHPMFTGQESLIGTMAWTPAGEQKIIDREFRFFSPEFADEDYQDPETGEYMNNVLIGGGLTNRPLFKNLTAVRASEHNEEDEKNVLTHERNRNTIYIKGNDDMNLKELLAKKTEELNDDEKAFIVENKADLTAEQVTTLTEAGVLTAEGDPANDPADPAGDPDPSADPANPSDPAADPADPKADPAGDGAGGTEANDKPVTLKASEIAQLRADAARGVQASEQLAHKAVEEHVSTLVFSDKNGNDGGKLPVAAKDSIVSFYETLNDKQRKAFDGIVAKLPTLQVFSQFGDSGKPITGTAVAEVDEKAAALMASDTTKSLTYGAAVRTVLASEENKDLKVRFEAERAAQPTGEGK